jgi:hypothetical protein
VQATRLGSMPGIGTGVSPGTVFSLIIPAAWHGCATTVVSFGRVLNLRYGCRSSLRTKDVCECVRCVWAVFLTLDMVVGLACALRMCVSVLGCVWCELVHELVDWWVLPGH